MLNDIHFIPDKNSVRLKELSFETIFLILFMYSVFKISFETLKILFILGINVFYIILEIKKDVILFLFLNWTIKSMF